MIQTPALIGDILGANGLENLGKGELIIPEMMLNRLLEGLDLPPPLEGVRVACHAGYFLLSINLDLAGYGVPMKPRVEQAFELVRLRIEPINQFILLAPRGGLRLKEEKLARSRLSPMASAILASVLHTPTLLKLVRDRFPRRVSYEHGRLHINLAGSGLMDGLVGKKFNLGHVEINLIDHLSIRDVLIRRGAVVIRFRFNKEELLEELHREPPDGFYDPPERPERRPQRLLPEQASEGGEPQSRRKQVLKATRSAGRMGRRLARRIIRRK